MIVFIILELQLQLYFLKQMKSNANFVVFDYLKNNYDK